MSYLGALVITILSEYAVFLILIRKEPLKLLFLSGLINCFTQPIATMFYQAILTNIFVIECIVFLVEIPLIKCLLNVNYLESVKLSLLANLTSASLGFILP